MDIYAFVLLHGLLQTHTMVEQVLQYNASVWNAHLHTQGTFSQYCHLVAGCFCVVKDTALQLTQIMMLRPQRPCISRFWACHRYLMLHKSKARPIQASTMSNVLTAWSSLVFAGTKQQVVRLVSDKSPAHSSHAPGLQTHTAGSNNQPPGRNRTSTL